MVRALPCHGRGREFESRRIRHIKIAEMATFLCYNYLNMLKSFLLNKPKLRNFLKLLLPPFLTLCILVALFAHFKITPFGDNTMATMDGNIQYVDFFDYYKEVLDGKNTIGYTFSKEIGGNMLGAFSYYLASPINLLLKFFPENKIELFFTFAVTIRLMLASLTFYIFLKSRIEKNPSRKTYILFVLFSLFYALSSYSFQQSSNVMWLDGVWLLPLMMLGVSKIFEKKDIKLFVISSTCALIFNWYSGFIALLFCAFWFFFELILRSLDQKPKVKEAIKTFWQYGWRLALATLAAVLISCIILIPSFKAMGEGSRGGGADWGFLRFGLRGKIYATLAEYYPGTNSGAHTLSVFIGALSLITAFSVFLSKKVKKSHKIVYFLIAFMTLLLFYYGPFYFMFSLLKDVGSYQIRYSFGCFAILLFLVMYILKNEKLEPKTFVVSSILFFVACLGFDRIMSPDKTRLFYGLFVIAFSVLLLIYHVAKNTRVKNIFFALIALISLGEVVLNSYLVLENYNKSEKFTTYAPALTETIDKIKESDDSTYRIRNLTTRCSFCLNEGLAHSYNSIDGYTSSPDDKEIKLLNSLGYKRWYYQSNITRGTIVSADSLLSVKYYIEYNKVSENPYVLPFAFSTSSTSSENLARITYDDNTFAFQNEIYKNLSGIDEDIYKKVNFTREIKDSEIIYHLDTDSLNENLVYAQIITTDAPRSILYDGDEIKTQWYAHHSGPSVVGVSSKKVTLKPYDEKKSLSESNIEKEYFYYLDIKTFEKMTEKIKSENKVTDFNLNNSAVSFTVDLDEPQTIFTSIHAQNGWEITVNGKKIEPKLFNNSLITFNLESGKNDVKIEFHVPGFKLGIALFVLGLVLFVVLSRFTS